MTSKKSFFRSPLFWGLHFTLFLAGIFFSIHYYPKAFPVIDLQIKMDRTQALESAKTLALKNHWAPENFQQAASFDSDQATQTFIELEAGGRKRLSEVIRNKLYAPYTWTVRHFKEGSIEEALVTFTPDGEFYGFRLSIPETQPGSAISPEAALKIAERAAAQEWNVPLSNYSLIEKSSTTQPSKRVDHLFVYELKNQSLGDGKFRLSLSVAGDRLRGIRHSVDVPEAFTRKYGEMRSANNTIAAISTAAMVLLYLLGGCVFGVFYLARKRWLVWKAPLIAAAIVALGQGLERINQLPLSWMHYDTAIPKAAFLIKTVLMAKLVFLGDFFVLALSFMAAESLGRLAFPKHPQLWKIWSPRQSSSIEVLGRTLGGYLAVGLFFAYVVAIYLIGSQVFGWWSPSDVLFQPDALASYFPWFTSISQSLHAGFWEESLFRAVPIAGAALLGQRFGKRRLWIALGFIIQALIFASAHANYPAQPSYARVVELIIPSICFGLIYLNFGLLPGIILHFTFDVISFAIPLFAAHTPRIWADQAMVIGLTAVPFLIVLFGRWRSGRWRHIDESALNQSWTPHARRPKAQPKVKAAQAFHQISPSVYWITAGLGLVLLSIWTLKFQPKSDTWSLNVTRSQAIQVAREFWKNQLTSDWEPQAQLVSSVTQQDEFVWQTNGPETYHRLTGTYLAPPYWSVRFVRFNANVEERAEIYQVLIGENQKILGSSHVLPENRELKSLKEDEARILALSKLNQEYQLKPPRIQEISSTVIKQPRRLDWYFTFRDRDTPLKEGESRISVYVTGDQVSASSRHVFIPEEWIRHERSDKTSVRLLNTAYSVVLAILALSILGYCLIQWTKLNFDVPFFRKAYLGFLVLATLSFLNSLPASLANFSTVEPRFNQLVTLVIFGLIKVVFTAAFPAILAGYLSQTRRRTPRSGAVTGIAVIAAFGLGIIITVGLAFTQSLLPKDSPVIPSFQALSDYSMVLTSLDVFARYCHLSLLLIFILHVLDRVTQSWTHRTWLGFLAIIFLCFCTSGAQAKSLPEWLVFGSASSILFSLAIYFPLRDHPELMILTLGAYGVISQVRQIFLHPYPQVGVMAGLSILLVGFLPVLWYLLKLWRPRRT